MKIMWIVLYNILAKHLPKSRRFVFFRYIRSFLFRKIAIEAGKDINIEKNATFNHWIRIGDHSGIGVNCELNGMENGIITIGKKVMMGPNVVIYTRNHETSRTDIPMQDQGYSSPQPVNIGDDVWIGRNVIILPGANIGDGVIIAAGAVVPRGKYPSYTIIGGVPARVIKSRKENSNEKNDRYIQSI